MKIAAILFLVSLTTSSFAKDFRVLDFGDECRDVVKLETSNGSTLHSADERGNLYTFDGAYDDGLPVGIAYWCAEGKFNKGVYIFDSTSFAEASQHYRALKRRLQTSWGEPRELVVDSGANACMWERKGTRLQLSLAGPHGGEGWNVAVGYEPVTASESQYRAHTPPKSPFKVIGSEVPQWPDRTSMEYQGRATIRAKYRFVYDAENGYEQNPHLVFLPDNDSQTTLPYLTRWVFESDDNPKKVLLTERPEEIWITNVADAAVGLLGKQLAEDLMAGKHAQLVGEAVVVVEGFYAGYECDMPSFATRFVEVKREVAAPSRATRTIRGC